MGQATEDRKKSQKRSDGMSTLQLVAVAGSLGLTLFVNIIVGIFIGRFMDSYFNTSPFGLMTFALLGSVTGFWTLYKKAGTLNERGK